MVLPSVTYVTNVAPYALDVVMLLGLGLAVDYSLVMVNRFREGRAAGLPVAQAVARTAATAGRTVTFSALTVATSLSGLLSCSATRPSHRSCWPGSPPCCSPWPWR